MSYHVNSMCDAVNEPDLMDSYVGQGLQTLNHTDTECIDLICNAWLGEKDGNTITEKNHSLKIKCKNLPAVAGQLNNTGGEGDSKNFENQ